MKATLKIALVATFLVFFAAASASAGMFDPVSEDSPAYGAAAVLFDAGLLPEFESPSADLSRLEFAVIVQHGLAAYGSAMLGGGEADPAVESALESLAVEFATELAQLGTSSPGFAGAVVAPCECEEECDPCSPPEIEVGMYGDFYIQGQAINTELTDDSSTEFSDVTLYWGELGWDASLDEWSGHFSLVWDTDEDEIAVNEVWGKYQHPERGTFFQIGQILLPFGNNDYYFPTYPAVNDLGYTTAHAIGAGVDRDNFALAGYAFNPVADNTGDDDTIDEFSVTVDITKQEADECQDGWRLTSGYTSHLPEHDLRLAGDGPLDSDVAAFNVFGRYDWGGNRYHLIADYTKAIDEYDPAELDVNLDGSGDRPQAANFEFVYEPKPDRLWGFSYQLTDEFADYANERYGLMYGERISELVMFKLEFTHGIYDMFATGGQDTDNTFVAEFNLAF